MVSLIARLVSIWWINSTREAVQPQSSHGFSGDTLQFHCGSFISGSVWSSQFMAKWKEQTDWLLAHCCQSLLPVGWCFFLFTVGPCCRWLTRWGSLAASKQCPAWRLPCSGPRWTWYRKTLNHPWDWYMGICKKGGYCKKCNFQRRNWWMP